MILLSNVQFTLLNQLFSKKEIMFCLEEANAFTGGRFAAFVDSLINCYVEKSLLEDPDLDLSIEKNVPVNIFLEVFLTFKQSEIEVNSEYIMNSIDDIIENIDEEANLYDSMESFERALNLCNENLTHIQAKDFLSQKQFVLDVKKNILSTFEFELPSYVTKNHEEEMNTIGLIDELSKFLSNHLVTGKLISPEIISSTLTNLSMTRKNIFHQLYAKELNRYKIPLKGLITAKAIKIEPTKEPLPFEPQRSLRKSK